MMQEDLSKYPPHFRALMAVRPRGVFKKKKVEVGARTSSSERTASLGVAKISQVGRNCLFIPKSCIALIFLAGMTRY
jgi:hypothetical protein